MPIKLNGATNGSVELDVPAAVGSDLQVTLPATAGTALVAPGTTSITVPSVNGTLDRIERTGNIVQVKAVDFANISTVNITKAATPSVGALYGIAQGNRIYATIASISITPTSATNRLIVMGQVGYSAGTRSDKGAHGLVAVKNNAAGFDPNGTYPWYTGPSVLTPGYLPSDLLHVTCLAGDTNAQTWDLKSYAYNETNGSASESVLVVSRTFTVMEVSV